MARHGFGFKFQVVTETAAQYGSRWATAAVLALAVIAVAILVIPWNSIFPPQQQAANVPVAHSSPLPSPSSPPAQIINITGYKGPVCIYQTAKPRGRVTLVKVP